MLYLEPPFHIFDGISVFGDHEDLLQYYYMPLYPHLTVKMDEETGLEIPQIQLIKYRGEAGSGGFLNFDVNLGIEDDKLAEIRAQIRSANDLDDEPRLAPVPLLDGYVKLMMLGKETQAGDEEGSEDDSIIPTAGPEFVVKMSHYAKPALYGTNQASFSVKLDEAGVVVVEEAIQGEMSPIGVVYSLDYLALRNGYKVKVTANWERVQHHLEESFGVNTPIFSSSVDEIVDELIEDRVIDMQVDKLFVTDDSTASMEARMDQAVNQIKDMVLDNFFEPSLQPIPPSGNDTISDAGRVATLILSGGASEQRLFTRKKVDITRIDKKKLDVSMSERTAVVRSIYPQGHLEGLFSILRSDDVDLSRFVIPVELDHPWFQKRTVNVIARTDFTSDDVESLNVNLKYGNDSKNTVLDKSKTEDTIEWLSEIKDGEMLLPVMVSYDVHFKDVDTMERPSELSSEPEILEVENVEIRPHDLYGSVPVTVMALDFPWETYPNVEVSLRYSDPENNINIDDHFLLNANKTQEIWKMFTLDPAKTTFSYQLIYRSADHRDIEMPWTDTDEEKVTIRDPFPKKRRLNIVPAVNWAEVQNIFVDVTYEDVENDVREAHALSFAETDNTPKEVILKQFKNPEQRIMEYKVTMIFKDGRILEIPPCQTINDRVFLTPQMRGHSIIRIDPSLIPFEEEKIAEAKLNVRFIAEAAGLLFNDSFSFGSSEDPIKYFEYDFADENQSGFEYQLTFHHENGLQRSTDWTRSNESELRLSA